MTEAEMPKSLARVSPLLTVSRQPAVVDGYLDLLGEPTAPSGPIQALWESTIGPVVYDPAQGLLRRLLSVARPPRSVLERARGGFVLDVGCGPGGITRAFGRLAGPAGLAVGMDVSGSMLRRAAAATTGDDAAFLRADARQLPFPDRTFDVVISLSVLQLIPEPLAVLAEMSRVLAPGGRMALLIPTVRGTLFDQLAGLLPDRAGLRFFAAEELADTLHHAGVSTVHTRQHSQLMWVLADKPAD